MGDFLLDAIAQFLKGDEWIKPVHSFMDSHKLAFVGLADAQESYSLQHHAIFVEFKELAEKLLENIIQDLGCDPSTFVKTLEEAISNEAGGPKEEEVQLLVKTLLTYDDFHGFCQLMQNYVEWNAVPSIPSEETTDYSTFDPNTYFSSNEWIIQEVVAKSLFESQSSGQLAEEDLVYIPWAQSILEMKEFYYGNGDSTVEQPITLDDPMVVKMKELQEKLVHERLKVDLLVAQRLSERNAGMRLQMSALYKHAASNEGAVDDQVAISTEQELSHLCDRLETIQTELKTTKKRCFGFKSVSAQHLDEIYLFLKEKIHFKQDLAQCENEIADFIFARVASQDSAIVPDLLQWLLLESEALDIQNEIQSKSFQSPRAEAKDENVHDRWVQEWNDEQQAYYYVNAITGESQWEQPMSKDGEPILGYWSDDGQWHPYSFLDPTPVDALADSKDQSADVSFPSVSSNWTQPVELQDIGAALESALSHNSNPMNMLDVEASLQKVLKEHADESKKLEIALQVEHARQTQDIQRRKAQRRQERKMKKAARAAEEKGAPLIAPPPPVDLGGLSPLSGCQINICLPEGGKLDLMSLLSEADERVRRERRSDSKTSDTSAPASTLNATTLRYLAEKIAPTSKLIEIEEIS